MTVNAETLHTWCAEIGAAFRDWEHNLSTTLRRDRDATLIEFAIRALAEGADPTISRILEAIDRRRAHQDAA